MEPMWPLSLNGDDCDSTPHCLSEAAFACTAAIVRFYRFVRSSIAAITGNSTCWIRDDHWTSLAIARR